MTTDELVTGGSVTDPDVDSITAGRVENKAIGDGINYVDPAWLARSGAGFYYQTANTFDGYATQTAGGADVRQLDNSQQADTNSNNAGAACGFADPAKFALLDTETWDKDRTVAMKVGWNRTDATYIQFFNGRRSSKTPRPWQIGIEVSGGDLKSHVADGSGGSGGSTKDTLISGIGTGVFSIRMELTAGEKVGYYVDGTKEGETTTNIPTGDANNSDYGIGVGAETSDSNAAKADFYGGIVVQHP